MSERKQVVGSIVQLTDTPTEKSVPRSESVVEAFM